jgi:hypothetical protein
MEEPYILEVDTSPPVGFTDHQALPHNLPGAKIIGAEVEFPDME